MHCFSLPSYSPYSPEPVSLLHRLAQHFLCWTPINQSINQSEYICQPSTWACMFCFMITSTNKTIVYFLVIDLECFTINCVTLWSCSVRYYALFLVGRPYSPEIVRYYALFLVGRPYSPEMVSLLRRLAQLFCAEQGTSINQSINQSQYKWKPFYLIVMSLITVF